MRQFSKCDVLGLVVEQVTDAFPLSVPDVTADKQSKADKSAHGDF